MSMIESVIDIGDKVYIGGLFGEDFKEVNNKIGIVNEIIFSSTPSYTTYIVNVLIGDTLVSVNLAYVFKLDQINEGLKSIVYQPHIYFMKKLHITGIPDLVMDDLGRSMLFCRTRENTLQPLTLTNLN